MNEQEIVRLIATLGAVVLGFVLGQVSEWIKSLRRSEKQKKTVRRLIELEAKNNVAHIQRLWDAILERKEDWKSEDGEFLYAQLADQASRVPFPPLTTGAWQANLADIVSAYTQSELETMWRFQRDLERIQSLHEFFCVAQSERRESSKLSHAMHGHAAMGAIVSGWGFMDSVNEPAKEFKGLTENVLDFEPINA